MRTTWFHRITWLLILLVVLGTAVVYPRLPETMVTHWGVQGQPNGWMSRFWGVAIAPLMMVALYLLFWAIPSIDPLKENIAAFRPLYNLFVVGVMVFLAYVHGLSLAWNLGWQVDIGSALLPVLGLFFIGVGWFLPRAKPNWFVGIRTPWTLSDPQVWEDTHRLGGKAFMLSGVVMVLAIFLPVLMWVAIVVLVALSLALVVYSYLRYRALHP